MCNPFTIISIMSKKTRGIGINGNLPWNIPEDLQFFKKITSQKIDNKQNVVIMGRKTYESIGKPLPNRLNICITSIPEKYTNINEKIIFVASFQHALDYLNTYKGNIFVIGGEQIYIEAIKHPLCVKLIINKIEDEDEQSIYYNKQYDTFFPIIDENIYSLDRTETLIKNVVTTFIFGKI